MKYLLCIADYKDERQWHFETFHSPRNRAYCEHHGFNYLEIKDINLIPEDCRQRKIVWYRFFMIRKAIKDGILQHGDIISQIDADICIVNGSKSFEPSEGKSFAYAIDSCNTHCMGAFSIRITDWSIKMLDHLLDENRWNKFKDHPFWKVFHEQASWYSLAGIKDTFENIKQPGWNTIPHLGWNSTTANDPIYSLKELYDNVEILPVEWNVTCWENKNKYFRIPTKTNKMEDVIFRHFAGSRHWNSSWALIKLIQ